MTALARTNHASAIESVLIQGDLSKLTPEQRVSYHNSVCESVGLNALTRPFEYITLNGKLVLYATKNCGEQLRRIHKISVTITAREKVEDLYIVTARATYPDGRTDESTGAISLAGLKGDALANAIMKSETKAKRRVTLSIVGLGMLDESEVESVKAVETERTVETKPNSIQVAKKEIAAAKETYVIPFGKYKGQLLTDVTIHELENYVEYIQKSALEGGKELKGSVLEFVSRAGDLIESRRPIDLHEEIPF